MATFPSTVKNNNEGIDAAMDVANEASNGAYNEAAASTATLTTAQLINGIYKITSGAASSLTTPTAADIVAALKNPVVGSRFDFWVINGGSGTATLVAGTGVTLKGFTAPATTKSQAYIGIVTDADAGAEAVNLVGLASAGI